jgi:hypothetical protein
VKARSLAFLGRLKRTTVAKVTQHENILVSEHEELRYVEGRSEVLFPPIPSSTQAITECQSMKLGEVVVQAAGPPEFFWKPTESPPGTK